MSILIILLAGLLNSPTPAPTDIDTSEPVPAAGCTATQRQENCISVSFGGGFVCRCPPKKKVPEPVED